MLNEIDIINTLKDRFNYSDKYVLLGVGDDCAVTRVDNNNLVLSTKDTIVEDVHFKVGKVDPSHIARKSVAVSISDICAMGGKPKYFLSTIGIPKNTDEKFTDAIIDGFELASEEFNVLLIGGNLTKSEKIFIDLTVIGEIEEGKYITRKGAVPGDLIFVSGTLGDSALGLRKLEANDSINQEDDFLIKKHTLPQPRITLGAELTKRSLAKSMIDISDGLILDLERITVEYKLGADVFLERLPISVEYRANVSNYFSEFYEPALSGGEDYELLFTTDEGGKEDLKELSDEIGLGITEIGRITEETVIRVFDKENKLVDVDKRGYIHLSS